MITEDYVSFETAKLLKEKGFDESCEGFYVNSGVLSHTLSNANNEHLAGVRKMSPNDLEEAARKYQEGVPVDTVIYYCGADEDVYFTNRIVDAFIVGAKWDREQMMSGAVEGLICATITGTNAISFLSPLPKELTTGDKVHVIIVKEDSNE